MKVENTYKDWFASLLGSAAMTYAGYGWHMDWITSKEAGIVAFIGFVLLFLRTKLTQVISDGLGKVFEAVMKKIFGGGTPPTAIILLMLMAFSSISFAQNKPINAWEVRLLNKTDSVLISGVGQVRWDNTNKNFRFGNGTSWTSYWKTSGTTTITTPVLVGNPTFSGTITGTGNLTLGTTGTSGSITLNRPVNGTPIGTITQTDTYTDFNNAQGSGHRMLVAGDPRLTITSSTGVDWTLGSVGFQGSSGGISLGGAAPIASTIDFGGGGNIRASSSNGVLNYLSGTVSATSGTVDGHRFNATNGMVLSSGTTNFNQILINTIYNTTGTYSGTARGIYYNPTLTNTIGLTHIAFENASGQLRFGGVTQDDTKSQMLVKDATTNQVFWRDASTITGSTYTASNGVQLTGSDFAFGGNILTDKTITIGDLTAPSAGTLTFHGWGFDLLKFTKAASSASARFGSNSTTYLETSPSASMLIGGTTGLLAYTADKSANYTDRTVVDKGYVDSKAGTSDTDILSFEQDDWFYSALISTGWNGSTSGTGAGTGSSATDSFGEDATENAIGTFFVNTGTTSTGNSSVTRYYTRLGRGNTIILRMRMAVGVLSDATDTYTVTAGYRSATAGAFFRYTHSVNAGKYQCVTSTASTETATDSGVTVDTQFHILEMRISPTLANVEFYIDGVLVATNTTNLPTTSDMVPWQWQITKSAGTADRKFYIDWHDHKITRTTSR